MLSLYLLAASLAASPAVPVPLNPAQAATTRPASRDRAALEREFEQALSGATLVGIWQMTSGEGLAGRAQLSEPRTEKYSISAVRKLDADRWAVTARIQFADKDVDIPVPVRVVWADDVPIITLDEIWLPMLGSYSARVMIHRGFYSGTWFGKDYGGVLCGQIVHEAGVAASRPAGDGKPTRPTSVPVRSNP
ncbi:MAG: hypothetical protein CHACPFDD_03451 [Phycisphaerae bacterium]|nr:hypothetical protein [Phycisphaerae bacterium]